MRRLDAGQWKTEGNCRNCSPVRRSRMAPEWLNEAMRNALVPLDTAAEDIHTVYKSPREIMESPKTHPETENLPFLF